jgi:hypothetical protein
MVEASWGDAASPDINWRMSAALENVPRGLEELVEVTSLEKAVRAWLALDPAHQEDAILIPQHALIVEGVSMIEIRGDNIGSLALKLPDADEAETGDIPDLDDAG